MQTMPSETRTATNVHEPSFIVFSLPFSPTQPIRNTFPAPIELAGTHPAQEAPYWAGASSWMWSLGLYQRATGMNRNEVTSITMAKNQ